ncbi:hypothetical protein [Erwinia sp. SLM-02]|uniref:hypothetical protein n=1 Tax=Erwinia sp. SLM-02 TaxID=3020057 RepID=UPI003080E2DC
MDNTDLQQVLSYPDGAKLIGRCPDIQTLRTIEPSVQGQRIEVVSYNAGWNITEVGPVGGGEFYFDANDTTSSDNGITIFVTASGHRWKRYSSNKKILLQWAGLTDGMDLSAPWQKAIDIIAEQAKKKKSAANLPVIYIEPGEYRFLSGVTHYNFISTVFNGEVRAKSEIFDATPAVWIRGLPLFRDQQIGGKTWSGFFNLLGPGRSAHPDTLGLKIGNDAEHYYSKDGTGESVCSLDGFRITQFGTGVGFTGYDSYLHSFTNFRIGLCRTNVSTLDNVIQNSGERITFLNGTIWGGGEANGGVFVNNAQFDLQFIAVSFDYLRSFIKLGPSCGWSTILLDACHMEAYNDYIVESNSPVKAGNVVVKLQNCDFLNTGNYRSHRDNSPDRKLFKIESGVSVILDGINNRVTVLPTNEDLLMSDSPNVTALSITRMIYPSIPSPAHIKNLGARFEREKIGSLTSANDSLKDYCLGDQRGFPSLVVGQINGANALIGKIAVGETNGFIAIKALEFMPVERRSQYMLSAAIQYKDSPKMNVQHFMKWFDAEKKLLSTDDYIYHMAPAIANKKASNYAEGGERCIPTFMPYHQPPVGAVYMCAEIHILNIKSDINITNFMVGEV